MQDNVMHEIIELCLTSDRKAASIYKKMSACTPDPELASFWLTMSEEETRHVRYWERLSALSMQGLIPQVFDRPYEVVRELWELQNKVDVLMSNCMNAPNVENSFLVAFRLEYYLMNSAFETLFRFTRHLSEDYSPEDDYDQHLDKFIDGLNRFGSVTPELELLGETVKKLWEDNKRLSRDSNIDELTGVLNRRGLDGILTPLSRLAQRGGQNVAVLMIDIDNFKDINDSYGHLSGDRVLRDVACAIKDSVRNSDIVARYGGEEFIVFLSSVGMDAVGVIGEKIRSRVEALSSGGIHVTISIGAAQGVMGPDVEYELDLLMSRADSLMYDAKRSGKNKVVC